MDVPHLLVCLPQLIMYIYIYIYTWPEHDAFDLLLLSYDHMIIDHNEGLTITIIWSVITIIWVLLSLLSYGFTITIVCFCQCMVFLYWSTYAVFSAAPGCEAMEFHQWADRQTHARPTTWRHFAGLSWENHW